MTFPAPILVLAAFSFFAAAAHSQPAKTGSSAGYPSRPVRLVVPVPPGGSSDAAARIISQKLTDAWGQQVLVDNRTGAAEIIGTDIVAKANPDGYTLVFVSLRHSVNPSLLKLPYDTERDFDPVSMTAAVGNVLVVNPKSPVKSIKDLVALAKQRPGELTFASSGIGGAPHLIGEFFALQNAVKLTHVPYKGGGPAIADLVAGNVAMSFASMTSSVAFIKAGRLRALAVSMKERSRLLPDVPTMSEAGGPSIIVPDWQGILAPRGTPVAIVDKLYTEIARTLGQPDVQERFSNLGMDIIASRPAEFRRAISSEIARWGKVVKDANIKVD